MSHVLRVVQKTISVAMTTVMDIATEWDVVTTSEGHQWMMNTQQVQRLSPRFMA